MITVATQLEAPVKILFAGAGPTPERPYPFSVLGLGDIAIPGAFVALLRQFDVTRRGDGGQQQGDAPYFTAGMLTRTRACLPYPDHTAG